MDKTQSGIRYSLLIMAVALLSVVGSAFAAGKVGEMAADFTGLKDAKGKAYSLKDYRGKVVLILTVQHNCGGQTRPVSARLQKVFRARTSRRLGLMSIPQQQPLPNCFNLTAFCAVPTHRSAFRF
jgi:hypothetical protein